MKKGKSIIIALIMLIAVTGVKAQNATVDYFTGKWSVLLKGTPGGDAKMVFKLDKVNDALTGIVYDTTGAEISKVSNIDQKENEITLSFNAQGYDVTLTLTKKDDDHATGSLMGMFDAEGERVKDKQ